MHDKVDGTRDEMLLGGGMALGEDARGCGRDGRAGVTRGARGQRMALWL